MCGFTMTTSTEFSMEAFREALEKTVHRGPDHQSATFDYTCSWGFNRLAIMDLSSKGNQPFKYKGYQVVCNGEIGRAHV